MDLFPLTRHSVLLDARSADPVVRDRALGALVETYWRPVYKYLRLRWQLSREDAEDVVQGFFTRAVEKGFFDRYDSGQARFRTYLRTCVDGFAANEKQAARRLKRGGGVEPLRLNFARAEGELRFNDPAAMQDPDAWFHREWVRSLFALAVHELRLHCEAQGKLSHFALFERYDLQDDPGVDRPTYVALAAEFGLPVTQVNNHLAAMRRAFRRIVLERLRALTASEEEFRVEARQLLGIDPS